VLFRSFRDISPLVGILIFFAVCIAVFSVVSALIDEQTYSYSISESGLSIELGLLSRYKKVIRYEKIQDIKLHCGFLESFYGIANMEIETGSKDIVEGGKGRGSTMAMAMMAERIPYLKLQDAYALRSKLLEICGITYPSSQQPLRQALPLSQKKPLKKTVGYVGIFTFQVLLVGILLWLFGQSYLTYIGMGLALLALLNMTLVAFIMYAYEQLYMRKYFYDENKETLVIRKGVFGWNEIVVPYRNIQSIYVDQDWYDVFFDTWDIWITTVTATSGPMAHIDGTSREDAEKLARLLLERVEKSRKRRD
jgi:membrane protein YdbS with pleckstrin-like domain